jgi:hypothetical protein
LEKEYWMKRAQGIKNNCKSVDKSTSANGQVSDGKSRITSISKHKKNENERFAQLKPSKETSIEEWQRIIKTNFPDLLFPAEVGLSVIAQLLIEDIKNPFALVYVDVPSSGKTITLNFFKKIPELIYTTDNITAASFISHAANKSEEQLRKIDILPKIRYRTLVVRDLAPIFSKKEENIREMIGLLTRVFDGEGLETNSGVHSKRSYTGDYLFMMLAASTPIRSRIWKVMGNLGSRLFFLNIGGKEKDEDQLVEQLRNNCREKENACRNATSEFLRTLFNKHQKGLKWDKEKDEREAMKIVARFAKVLARLRTPLNVEKETLGSVEYKYTQASPEMPDRLSQLLYNIARGHAILFNRISIDKKEDLRIVARVALDSAPPKISKVFKELIMVGGILKTNEVMEILKCDRPIALKTMKELEILKIVEVDGNLAGLDNYVGRPELDIRLSGEYKWFGEDECQELLF